MYKLELLENSVASVKIEMKGEEFATLRESIMKEFRNAKIDGFRKGHAPEDVVKKTFGPQIQEEIMNSVLRNEYAKVIKENELEPLGEIEIEKYNLTDDMVEVDLKFEVRPSFELPKYKGLNIEVKAEEVTEERVLESLKNVAARHKTFETLEKTVAENGDIANINFEGFVDGVAFEGGKAEGFDLVLGSKSFIDTFEDQIVGHSVNDEFDVNVIFPEEYHAEHLKGKPALFKVKLNALKAEKMPEINDELAKLNGYDTLDEYKVVLKAELENDAVRKANDEKYEKVADQLVENTTMVLPVKVVMDEANHQKSTLEQQLSMQGLDFAKFLELSGKTEEDFEKEAKERAEKVVKFNLIIAEIAKAEDIKVENEDIDSELDKLASMYRMKREELVEELKKAKLFENYVNQMASTVFMNKVKEFLVANN